MPKKQTLGRGLEAVFLENETTENGAVSMLRLSDIEPNPDQPRRSFDKAALDTLADSIRENGLIQPIAVRRSGPFSDRYQIVAGERRWRAAKLAGLTEIPVITLELDDEKTATLALIENIQREDLSPIEEATAYRELGTTYSLTQEQIAQRVGKSRSAVANTMRLLELPESVLPLVESGDVSAGHARAILSCTDDGDKLTLADKIRDEGLSVREAEALAKRYNALRKKAQKAPAEPSREERMAQVWLRSVEDRVSSRLGRRIRIVDGGKSRRVELSYEDDKDLETLLSRIAGEDIFKE